MLAHWDDVERQRVDRCPFAAANGRNLGTAAGSRTVGLKRVEIDPRKRSTAVHVHGAEEEIFFILGGSGLLWQDERTCSVAALDCIVHRAGGEAHTLIAGDDGLDALAFGTRVPTEVAFLPRAGTGRISRYWFEIAGPPLPYEREQAAGELEVPEPGARPPNVVNVADVEGAYGGIARALGATAGSETTGLNHLTLPPGETTAPAHIHSAEEEIFVILDGEATFELTPTPMAREQGREPEVDTVRRGHVVAKPPGGGMAHRFRAGDEGVTMLAYGTRDRKDITFYPESNRVFFRAVGVIVQAEHVGYPED